MGLQENRLIKVVQDENIPTHLNQLREFASHSINFDLDWDEWKSGYEAILNLNGYVLGQIVEAILFVARDDLGKEAIRESVKTLQVRKAASPSDKSIKLADGVLSLEVSPEAGWDGVYSRSEVQEFLTENL